jgi:hypothetical protein
VAWLEVSDNSALLAEFERRRAENFTALLRERTGELMWAQSHELPPRLPPPFENFPRGTQGWTTRKNQHGDTEWIPPPHLDHGRPRTNTFHRPEKLLRADEDDDEP